jgi:cell division protein FtsB
MKNAIRTVLLVAALTAEIITLTACNKNKENDQSASAMAQLAELNTKMEAMQAELDKAKSGNAAPEEIARLEAAVAEVAQEEQTAIIAVAEQKQEASAKQTTSTTPAASTATTTQTTTPATTAPAASQSVATSATATTAPATTTSGDFQMSGTTLVKYTGTIANVTIPNSVTSIGEGAFGASSITSITIPNSVTEIGDRAFTSCPNLTSITIPNSVKSIGGMAFQHSGLKSVTIQSGSIGYTAFRGCTGLSSVTLGNGVTNIETLAFEACFSLTSITIPASVTGIGNGPFRDCRNLTAIDVNPANTAYSSLDGVLYNKDKTVLIQYPAGKTGNSFTIPASVTKIGASAFYSCRNLDTITIQSNISDFGGSLTFGDVRYVEGVRRNPTYIGDLGEAYMYGSDKGPGTYRRTGQTNDYWYADESAKIKWVKQASAQQPQPPIPEKNTKR